MGKHPEKTEIIIEGSITTISFVEVCSQYAVSEDILLELLEYGLIAEISRPERDVIFNQAHLQRILSACRLHSDLHINTHGVILALELMDELSELRGQLEMLRRHMRNE